MMQEEKIKNSRLFNLNITNIIITNTQRDNNFEPLTNKMKN
jgi:hypothetical protein